VRVEIPSGPLLVLLSGGGDSVALLDLAVGGGAEVSALHVNYGLRGDESDADEEFVRELCSSLGVQLFVETVDLGAGSGNLQAQARDARYALAERLAEGDYATGHTASDQAETVLYRLAVSPGSRALHGMTARRGRLVRPLLGVTREEVRDYLRSRGLRWREDPSNADRRFARARVREDLLEALRTVGPAPERTIAETARQLREEAEVLDDAVSAAIKRLGGGLRVIVAYGTLRFTRVPEAAAPDPVELPVPGHARFGDWEMDAAPGGAGDVSVTGVTSPLTVRAWAEGDRMRPAGVGGTKTLQDLFTDRKVPRALRHTLPVVVSGDAVVWVAGVAVDERFAADAAGSDAVGLSATQRPR